MTEILAVFIGAILAGLLQTITDIYNRRRESEAVLTAIASEVEAICRLITHQRYLEATGEIAEAVQKGMWNGASYVIDIRENYFTVYEGMVEKLGLVEPDRVTKIVNFYSYCKSAIDSTRPDGPHAHEVGTEEAAANMVSVHHLLVAIVNLGNEIMQMPKNAEKYRQDAQKQIS